MGAGRIVGTGCAAVLLASAAAGCSGSDNGDAGGPASSPAASRPATIEPAAWRLGTTTTENPDGLAAIDHAVFVKTDDGRVVRIDPATGRVTAEADLDTAKDPGSYCQGIGSDGDTLWACSAGDSTTDVVRLDPRTLAVTARLPVDKLFDQYALPVVGGTVWVLGGDGSRLVGVDTATGRSRTSRLPYRCFQLAATKEAVYATCLVDEEVIAVDPRTRKVVASAQVDGPTNVATGDGTVWVSGSRGLSRFDDTLASPTLFEGPSAGQEGDLLMTGSAVWVRNPDDFLLRIDPATGAVTARYAMHPAVSGGSALIAYGSLWTSAYDDATVYQVDPEP
ncbi:PQQ-binding-like beta-propeller repeat protein [Nocardioides panacisoli]|uniref:YncE family protein n=1 Tax=Nocardioides panacisoli TaxID=627624 RepID=A0ABP7ICX3_9ACTN